MILTDLRVYGIQFLVRFIIICEYATENKTANRLLARQKPVRIWTQNNNLYNFDSLWFLLLKNIIVDGVNFSVFFYSGHLSFIIIIIEKFYLTHIYIKLTIFLKK